MHVLECAWQAAGAPTGAASATATVGGHCARCGTPAPLTATRHVISKVFTGFDTWTNPTGAGLCPTCSWGYTTPALRTHPHLVGQDQTMVRLARPALAGLLAAGPLAADRALIVPLRPGRKHLLPDAAWGRVTLDDIQLPWPAAAAARTAATGRLRRRGFGSRMLTHPAPPWQALRRRPSGEWAAILHDWSQLEPWRPRSPWLDLALYATLQETR